MKAFSKATAVVAILAVSFLITAYYPVKHPEHSDVIWAKVFEKKMAADTVKTGTAATAHP